METLESDPGDSLFTQIRTIVSENDHLDSLALLASSYYSKGQADHFVNTLVKVFLNVVNPSIKASIRVDIILYIV